MSKTNNKQVKTTTKQKVALILFGILLALIILELGLRIGGFMLSSYQRSMNKKTSESDYRILCLGESTTADGGKNSWPSQLELILNNKTSEIKFKVFNEGIGGTNTAFILSRLKDNLDKYKPDMVITMMGSNDGDINIKYEETLRVKMILLFEDLRVYKLSKLLLIALKNKIQSTIKDINTAKELELIKEEYKKESERYLGLGKHYKKQGMFKEAKYMFKSSIGIDANNYRAYILLGDIYEEEGMFKEAEYMFKNYMELNPDDNGYIHLSKIYQKQGVSNKEIEEFYRKRGFSFKLIEDNYTRN